MGWLSGYQYRKKVTISGSSGAGQNYQVKLSIGSSSGGDFHLEGHCVDFPNDIRFTDDDGETLLDYWIEDPTQDPITVWIEVKDSLDTDVDIYCYTPDHEILTEKGWVNIREYVERRLSYRVATLNPETNEVEYHKPEKLFKLKYKGKIIKQEGRVEFEVIPNHRLWIKPDGKIKESSKKWQFREARNLPRYAKFRLDFPFEGKEEKYFLLPGYTKKWNVRESKPRTYYRHLKLGRTRSHTCCKVVKPKKIPMDSWLRFLGIYLAEGSLMNKDNNKGSSVVISHKRDKRIDAIISDLGFKPYYIQSKNRTSGEYLIHNRQLVNYLKQFGHAEDKFIPRELLNLSRRQLKILFDSLMMGDGSYHKNGTSAYYATISKRLANDFQELALKVGWIARIVKKDKSLFKHTKHDMYFVNLSSTKEINPNSETDKRSEREYNGYVYSVQVPNHIIYVRRNGKPHWNGNCYYSNPSASSASDGEAVFEFFDDFSVDTTGDYTKTAIKGYSGTPTLSWNSGGTVTLTSTSEANDKAYYSSFTKTSGYAVDARVRRTTDLGSDRIGVVITGETYDLVAVLAPPGDGFDWRLAHFNGGTWQGTVDESGTESVLNQYYIVTLAVKDTEVKGYLDYAHELTKSWTPESASPGMFVGYDSNREAEFDWLRVRKYVDPEPTFSSASAEETPSLTCIDIGSFSSFSTLKKKTYPACLDTFQSSDVSDSVLSLISCSQDTLGLTDMNTLSLLILLNALDTVYVSDEGTLTFEISPSCLETLRLLESSSSSLEGLVRCLDNIGTKTFLSSLLSAICQSSDNIGGIDSELSHMLISSILTDKLRSKDASVSNIAFERNVLDIFTCQDASSLLKGIILSATDILNAQDLTEIHLIVSSSSIDIVKQRDTSVVNVTLHLRGEDIFKGEDFVSSSLQTVLSALDSFKVSDSSLSGTFAEILVSASDILATSDYNEIHFEFLQSAIDIIKSDDASSPVISFQLNIVDILQGLDTLTANLQAILGAISKFKSSGETSSYEVMLGIPIKIFKAQEKVLVFRAKKPFRFQVR
ncbi:hypothetical protein DRO24_01210 [Candidatus Bathyarchaeota archaeon]|nr:MAG: hypothetical protein DRO24_01210 [Candidatus Bathyarchaeota archaeon]